VIDIRVLGPADDNLVIAQRLSEWVASAPDLETDIALANIALDHLGVARLLLAHAAELEGQGRTEDDLAMFRSQDEFSNLLICELPIGDFAHTVTRQLLVDAYQLGLWAMLGDDEDPVLAGVAGKALMEARYHFRFSSLWAVRLGDGTDESHRRMQSALTVIWPYVDEMFDEHPSLRAGWNHLVKPVLSEAGLTTDSKVEPQRGGRVGIHTEHLALMLSEMQSVARAYAGVAW
jgi:ring-1,2-phenylacetyl-CoA epoxidase subunit PaaC